jgi:hypothetical protein
VIEELMAISRGVEKVSNNFGIEAKTASESELPQIILPDTSKRFFCFSILL